MTETSATRAAGSSAPACWPLPTEWATFIPPQAIDIKHETVSAENGGGTQVRPVWNEQWLRGLEAYVRGIVHDELSKAERRGSRAAARRPRMKPETQPAASSSAHRKVMLDDDRERVSAGDTVRFNYGIPPVCVTAKVVQRGKSLIALTPGHTPPECNLRSLRRYVGSWYKHNVTNQTSSGAR